MARPRRNPFSSSTRPFDRAGDLSWSICADDPVASSSVIPYRRLFGELIAVGYRPRCIREIRNLNHQRKLAGELAHVLGVRPSPEEIDAEQRRQLERLGLADAAGLEAWLEANDLEEDQFGEFVARESAIRKLREWMRGRRGRRLLVQPLLDELRLSGTYEHWVGLAAQERRVADAVDGETEK